MLRFSEYYGETRNSSSETRKDKKMMLLLKLVRHVFKAWGVRLRKIGSGSILLSQDLVIMAFGIGGEETPLLRLSDATLLSLYQIRPYAVTRSLANFLKSLRNYKG